MKNENVGHMDLKGPDGADAPWKAEKMPLQRGVLEPLSGTIEIPAHIGSPNARTHARFPPEKSHHPARCYLLQSTDQQAVSAYQPENQAVFASRWDSPAAKEHPLPLEVLL